MRLINRKDMEFLKPQRKIKEEEKSLIKESDKTKLFVSKEGCYVSNDRQDTGEYREYGIDSLIQITEEIVSINEKDEYIILYENSKGEDILVSGKKNRDYGQGKFRIGNSLKMITQKGLQLVYNLNTKVLHERKINVKLEFVLEEKDETTIHLGDNLYYHTINGEIKVGGRITRTFKTELDSIKMKYMTEGSIDWVSDHINSYNTELKITTPDEQHTIKRERPITNRNPFSPE